MKVAVTDKNKAIHIRHFDKPEIPPSGALIRVTGCGICGSDLDKWLHRDIPEGTVLGHEVVGVIDTLSSEAEPRFPHLYPGKRVAVAHHVPCQTCHYCRHGSPSMCKAFKQSNIFPGGFAEFIAVSADHLKNTVIPLPDDVSVKAASCIEPLACCLRAVDRIPEDTGNTAVVLGLGFIGLLTAQYLQLKGYTTLGLDIQPERAAFARKHLMLGEATDNAHALTTTLMHHTEGRGADVVFLSVVNPGSLSMAMQLVRDGGTLVLFTSYGPGEPILNQNELYFRELSVITSYSPSLSHLHQAARLIFDKRIAVDSMITHCYSLHDLPKAMDAYRRGEALKVLITL